MARRAERSRSDFLCPVMSGRDWSGGPWRAGPSVQGRTFFVRECRGETGAEHRGAQGRAFEVGLCLSGNVGETLVRSTVARKTEHSGSDFVFRECREETGAEHRGAQGRAFEVGLCLSGNVGETLVRSTVARKADHSGSDFVCSGMSGRYWCGAPWRARPSVRGRTLFVRECRGETGAEHRGAQGRAFEVGLCLSGNVGETLVRSTVARKADHSGSDFVCPGMSGRHWCGAPWRARPSVRGRTLFVRECRGETGAEHRGEQGRAFEVGLSLSGNVGETLVRSTVAHRAERSRSDFVCPGMSGRHWCGAPWRAGPSVRGRTLFVRECRGETGAEHRGAQGRPFGVGLCLSGNVGETLVRSTVARKAERSESDFVCPGMSGRDWCGGPWRAGPSIRGRTLFVRGFRG